MQRPKRSALRARLDEFEQFFCATEIETKSAAHSIRIGGKRWELDVRVGDLMGEINARIMMRYSIVKPEHGLESVALSIVMRKALERELVRAKLLRRSDVAITERYGFTDVNNISFWRALENDEQALRFVRTWANVDWATVLDAMKLRVEHALRKTVSIARRRVRR